MGWWSTGWAILAAWGLALWSSGWAAVRLTYTGESFAPKFSVSAGKTVKLLWGDGQSTTIDGPAANVTYTHNYAGSGTYQFRIVGDLDGVTKFQYNSSALSGDIGTLKYLTSLIFLSLHHTSVSGDIANLSGLTSLVDLVLRYTSVSGDIANLSGLTLLAHLHLYGTSVDTYSQGVLPDWDACNIYIQDLGLSQQEVDDFLCDLNTASSASVRNLQIHGTNAVPSAVGLACVNDVPDGLRDKGWTVTLSE